MAQAPRILIQPQSAAYRIGKPPELLSVVAESTDGGTLTYQWQTSDDGTTWANISGAVTAVYLPNTDAEGTTYFRCEITNHGYDGVFPSDTLYPESTLYPNGITPGTAVAYTNAALISIYRFAQSEYMRMLRTPYTKLCRLRFLNEDGSVAFAVDNNASNPYSKAFIAEGTITANFNNGQRRTASVTLDNVDKTFDYNVNHLWFGTQIALDEGMRFLDGSDYYIQQGIFLLDSPKERIEPSVRTITYSLVDKWANLDGTLYGNLESTYEVSVGTNLFTPISALLAEDKGNGNKVDRITPVYTDYYNNKTQTLPDGTTVSLAVTPYTLTIDSESGTIADVILGLAEMPNCIVGYDMAGALRLDPSQDDILDSEKPVQWEFGMDETTLLGMSYDVKNKEVYNDYIVVGGTLSSGTQAKGRAQNIDPRLPTNIYAIGRKTLRESKPDYYTDRQCQDYAEWKLKRSSVLQQAVSISCSQIFHIDVNNVVTICRTDKAGSPVERHLINGFSRPLTSAQAMTIEATSVNDYPISIA